MSEVITDKLTGRATAGDVTITGEGGTGTMQLQKGIVKSYINVEQDNSNDIDASFNTASYVDQGTGAGQSTLTNNMSGNTFSTCMISGSSRNSRVLGYDGTSARFDSSKFAYRSYNNSDAVDDERVMVVLHGDLA